MSTTQYIHPDGARRASAPASTFNGLDVLLYELTVPDGGPGRLESQILDKVTTAVAGHNGSENPGVLVAAKVTFADAP